jgi:hypothetical protein
MDRMQAASRTPLVALVVLIAISVPVVALLVSRDGGAARERPAPGLRLEGAPGELILYVPDVRLNKTATADGARQVTLQCLDRDGVVTFSAPQAWPFLDTDAGTLDPHIHVSMPPEALDSIARCRLEGTDPLLEGRRP